MSCFYILSGKFPKRIFTNREPVNLQTRELILILVCENRLLIPIKNGYLVSAAAKSVNKVYLETKG
jgi:hypothetical protein